MNKNKITLSNLKRVILFSVVLTTMCWFTGKAQDMSHKGVPDLTDFTEIYRDTTEFVAPTQVIRKDSILEPMRVVTNKFDKNWFVFATAGAHSFLGDYSKLGPFKGTISPDFSVGFGKWFTPGIGIKFEGIFLTNSRGYTIYQKGHYGYGPLVYDKDGNYLYRKMKTGWWDLSANVLFNLSRLIKGYEGMNNKKLMNQFLLNAGIGLVHHTGFGNSTGSANEISAHLEFQYSRYFTKSKRFSLDFKFRGLFYQSNFDGENGMEDYAARKVDCNLGFDIGFTWNLGSKRNNGWGNSVTEFYQRDFRQRDVLVVQERDVVVEEGKGKAKQGTLTFYVFYPNNYSGRNDAPIVANSDVNTLDYLAGGLFTQKRYKDTSAATSKLLTGGSLNGLSIEDIPTEIAEQITITDNLPRGYEMSSTTPMSLSLQPDAMTKFREEEGYYYAPIYDGQHVWQYRIDDATLGQNLISNENYAESQTFGLNSHNGLEIIRENMKIDGNDELVSFADVYAAINGNDGYIKNFTDEATVDQIKDILNNGIITMIQTEGMATSQDNSNSTKVGQDRNSALSENRANSVIKWLQENENLQDALYQSFFTQGANTINTVTDASTRGLNAKLNRGVKVRLHYLMK